MRRERLFPDSMLCGPASKSVIDYECDVCEGSGVEPGRVRASCTHCDGLGRRYICYHDMSGFPGTDYRGVTRVIDCPTHGINAPGTPPARYCCRDWRLFVKVVPA